MSSAGEHVPRPDPAARAYLRASGTFADLDEETIDRLAARLKPITVHAGEVLMAEGEPPGDAFFVVAGRLEATTVSPRGAKLVVGLLGPGDVVGEMALITGEPRSATVTALRDSRLYRMPERAFVEIVVAEPQALLGVTRAIVRRLDRSIHNRAPKTAVTVVGVIPAGTASDHRRFAARYADAAGSRLRTTIVGADELQAELGPDPTDAEVTGYLHRVEQSHDLTLLVADGEDTEWSRRCGRQADVNLFVGHRRGLEALGPVEIALTTHRPRGVRPPAELVVLEDAASPSSTQLLLRSRDVDRHHHVRLDERRDLERLARQQRGETVGVVLGGGGARGFAHLGVLKALGEAGVPIDHIAGTSIGSSVAAAHAIGWDWDTMLQRERWVTVDRGSLVDFSFPAVALASGNRLTSGMREGYGDTHIEDLWIDFFCVSTDLTVGAPYVHTTGPVWQAVRASAAIPGILPPVRSPEGHVLVDGGVLNNLPTDIMHDVYRPATVIAVDLRASVDLPTADLGDDGVVSGWRVAGRRLAPWKNPMEIPRMVDVLSHATAVTGSNNAELADLVFRPPVEGFGILEFPAWPRIVDAGYRHAVEVLAQWDGGSRRPS